ncbi:MAG: 50S ribosomal protein L18 [Planctomycetes bacterium RBG_16_64_10]|nr:MAG: 50S ribosomal protein L18 [Planctomycetes bacterium RBG_16_64_10]
MNHERSVQRQRQRRKHRVRKRLRGTPQQPRLTVFRSHKHIYAQVIDDTAGTTLVAASTRDAHLQKDVAYGGNKTAASSVGKALAERAVAAGIKQVLFDRGPYRYHGRVAALADGARQSGLEL